MSFLNRWVFFIKEEFCKVVSILMKATPNSSHIAVGVMGYQVTADMAHLKDTFILHQMFSRTPKSFFFQIKGTLMKNVFLAFKRRSKFIFPKKKEKKKNTRMIKRFAHGLSLELAKVGFIKEISPQIAKSCIICTFPNFSH